LPGDRGADIGLVLMIGAQHLNTCGAELGHSLLRAQDGPLAGIVAVRAGLIVQHADLHARHVCPGGRCQQSERGGEQRAATGHRYIP